MTNRATVAFAFSVIGAVYQMISPGIAALADRNTSAYYYVISFNSLLLTSLVVMWTATHFLEDWKGRMTWPSIGFALGLANLWNIVIAYVTPSVVFGILSPGSLSLAAMLALIPGPLIIMIGGILGFSAVRQYSREHGHAVLAQSCSTDPRREKRTKGSWT